VSAPAQWTFNTAVLLFMLVAVPIAVLVVAVSLSKDFMKSAMTPTHREMSGTRRG
jgi:hypothetical protein